jgi:hypothetical protein
MREGPVVYTGMSTKTVQAATNPDDGLVARGFGVVTLREGGTCYLEEGALRSGER